ncbi:uncharacterized protein C6orf132 homolog isoform X5 [Mizuhopecten yessoensis]|uniref:uncharacterized protein C6orf132 homolog isoform X5 n=1 Tax=Mizuhopecten yessoensis TaxID=6573 RepID=UPI000B45CA79|nr:uncharacterized protein C6orf132 homolog isoform X5 [Mizuhopecten yessoensis]
MSECYTLHSGWLERITKDTKGKERREHLWSVLKRNGFIFFFTEQNEHTAETHIGKLPINTNTVFTRQEKDEKKYDGYIFKIFARDKNVESNVKFKTTKKSSMELWRGYINILGKNRLPPDLDLPADCIQDMDFVLAGLRRSPKEPDGHLSARTNLSRDSGIPQDSVSSVTVTTKLTSASGGSGGSGGNSSLSSEGRGGKRHKFSNNPQGDDIYPSWFIANCSREKAISIFTAVGTAYGNTLMRESAQSTSQGTYVISYCSRIKDRMPVCDHFKILRTQAGYKIDVDTPHVDMTNLTDVMMFFIKLNGADRTQSLTTNDLSLLGLKDSAYSTYLPNKAADPTPRDLTIVPNREARGRESSDPPPGNPVRRDYDYEAPVPPVQRPKTVTGATLKSQMRKYDLDTKESARSNRHFHPDMTGSHTVAPKRKGGRPELPPQTRVSMPDPGQFHKSPRAAVSWQKDFHVHPQTESPPVRREETPPPPCEVKPVLGYENDQPGFDKVLSGQTMADVSPEIPPPNYKAPAPPPIVPIEVKLPSKSPPSFKAPEIPLTSHVTTGKTKVVNTTEISPPHKSTLPPRVSPKEKADQSVPALGNPAPPPPPPPPPIIGSGGTPSKSSDTKSNKILVTGRKGRLSSGDYDRDNVARRMPNARRPTAPNIWGMPDGRDRMMKLRSQSVPNLEDQLKGVHLNRNPLNERVTTSVIQRNPPKSVCAKQSVIFDNGRDKSEAKAIEPGVDASNPGGVGTLSKRFAKSSAAKQYTVNTRHSRQADPSPTLTPQRPTSTFDQLYINDVMEEDIYANDQLDEFLANEDTGNVYTNETPCFIEPIEYVNTRPGSSTTQSNSASASCVDTSGTPSVRALQELLNLNEVLGSPGLPITPQVTSPRVRIGRDIPLPAIPVESPQDPKDEIYDYLEDS